MHCWVLQIKYFTVYSCRRVAGVFLRRVGQLGTVAAWHRSGPCDAGQCLLPRPGGPVCSHGLHHPLYRLRRKLRRVCECSRRALLRLYPTHHLHQGRYYGDRQAKQKIGDPSGAVDVFVSGRHCCGFKDNTQTSKISGLYFHFKQAPAGLISM